MELLWGNNIETDWLEHTNALWASKNVDHIANRDFVQFTYEILFQNKEIHVEGKPFVSYNDTQVMPSFQYVPASVSELKYYITTLLTSQQQLAQEVCTSNQFTYILRQRLIVLERIFHAIVTKFHNKDNQLLQKFETHNDCTNSSSAIPKEATTGPQALLEIGVKTGLSLLFSLLQQNWQVSGILGIPSLCNSVLETTIDLIQKLPPLSLSNDTQLTSLGTASLEQVCQFLKNAVLHETSADNYGKVLSSEILLGIYLQRGSLRYLLEWIDMSLDPSLKDMKICSKSFKCCIAQLEGTKSDTKSVILSENELLTINDAALYLMQILVSMTVSYSGDGNIMDHSLTDSKTGKVETSDVFVWGSNSCHQLAEGNQEKILLPIKSKIFNQVQQVRSSIF